MKLGGKALDDVAGVSPEEIRNIYETGRQRLVALLERFDKVLATGGHELTSLMLSLSSVEVSELTPILKDIANAAGEAHVQQLVRDLVARAGFERTPIARLIEAAVGPAVGMSTIPSWHEEFAPSLVTCWSCSRGTRCRSCSTSFANTFTSIA